MTKLCMLAIWMGKFPNTFDLWKQTVLNNPTIDFYVITDNEGLRDEGNLRFMHMTLPEVKQRFQRLMDFRITLETPYKICDYKPLYGEAFQEITKDYEFWGHMDLDIILGDVRAFLTEEMFQTYDKLFEAGCFVIYRNTEEMRNLYKLSMDKENMAYPYKKAFRCDYACYFDEYMGMNILGWKYQKKVFRDQTTEDVVQDFGWQTLDFCSYITKESFVMQWKDGKLYRHLCDEAGRIKEGTAKEYMLVHIQKRKMEVNITPEEFSAGRELWIIPNCFQAERPQGELYTEQEKQQYAELIRENDKKRSIRNLKQFGPIQYIPHFIRSRRIRKWIFKEKGFF